MRRNAVAFLTGGDVKIPEGASLLAMSAGTLRGWKRRREKGALGPNLLGRPAYLCSAWQADEIRELAKAVGPKVSARYLKERMGHVPRAVMERVVRDYKKDHLRRQQAGQMLLAWEDPGRVWSCDWTEPDMPIDGVFKQILAVRDLGSSFNIKSFPTEERSALMACKVMEHLFMVHGAPLVLKTDGGSEFTAKDFKELLRSYGVVHLVSPPYYPPYNGAIEAGIGSLKTHALHDAIRRGRMCYWTCDDVEAGRLIANETSRPWGPKGPSPEKVWKAKSVIGDPERREFITSLEKRQSQYDKLSERTRSEMKADERRAIERTLVDAGCLVVTRRRITPGVCEEKMANLT